MAELSHGEAAEERKRNYDENKQEHGIVAGDEVYMWIPRNHKLELSAMGPMVVKRFLDGTKRTAVLHPPGQPDQSITVHVDRLVKAHARPAHLMIIPSDLERWVQMRGEADAQGDVAADQPALQPALQPDLQPDSQPRQQPIPQAELEAPPQLSRVERSIVDRERELWEIEKIVDRVEQEDGSRRYRVRYVGYEEDEDRWYDEEELRAPDLKNGPMLDEFDAQRDEEELQSRLAPKGGQGARRSGRQRRRQGG